MSSLAQFTFGLLSSCLRGHFFRGGHSFLGNLFPGVSHPPMLNNKMGNYNTPRTLINIPDINEHQ